MKCAINLKEFQRIDTGTNVKLLAKSRFVLLTDGISIKLFDIWAYCGPLIFSKI